MKKIVSLFCISLLFYSCTSKKTELVLLGAVHQPIENFTPDSLYNILVRIKPNLILFEVDSSFFTDEFTFKKPGAAMKTSPLSGTWRTLMWT